MSDGSEKTDDQAINDFLQMPENVLEGYFSLSQPLLFDVSSRNFRLLDFYKNNNAHIKFRLSDRQEVEFSGFILELFSEKRGVIIEEDCGSKVAVNLDDIDTTTIMPFNKLYEHIKITQRTPLPTGLRFNILQRDGFKCVYCGKSGQDVQLEVDHLNPVSNGGLNNPSNLVTACFECNRGKSNNIVEFERGKS